MIPILFNANAINFHTNGIGRLMDAVTCTVTEVLNGEFELAMQYPIAGRMYRDIAHSAIIVADPGDGRAAQPFRIYKISKPINGIITINAEHISYQLNKVPVSPFSAEGVAEALNGLRVYAAATCPFEFWTDKTTAASFTISVPSSIRSNLGGKQGSILDVYGGEYEFDGYTVKLYNHRGRDAGVRLAYGKNITDLSQEENISNTITGIYPYWAQEEEYVELPEKILLSTTAGSYPYPRIATLNCTAEWDEKPTVEQLRAYAQSYISRSGVGVPSVSIRVSFVALWQTEEYKDIAPLERVQLGDRVTVEFEKLGISAKAKVVKTVYNVLLDRYDNVDLGETRTNLAQDLTVQQQEMEAWQQEINNKPSRSYLDAAVSEATGWITGAKGGYVVMHKDANGQPYEILIMDMPDINTAQKIWRWNQGGLGYSSKGYAGPYETAITQNGAIVADFITVGTMMANIIKGGILTLGGKDNGNGVARILDANGAQCVQLTKDGIEAVRGLIAGWNLNSSAFYKDVTAPDGTIYRVYFQPPLASAPDSTWVLSCQKSTDGGKSFYGTFVLFSDGAARFGNGKILFNADGSAILGGGKVILNPDGSASLGGGRVIINANGSASLGGGKVLINEDGSASFGDGKILLKGDGSAQLGNGKVNILADGSANFGRTQISGTGELSYVKIARTNEGFEPFTGNFIVRLSDGGMRALSFDSGILRAAYE